MIKPSILLSTLIRKRPERTFVQIFRYFIVSVASLVIDFAVLAGLTELLGIHYLISAAISYTAGLVFNYLISVMWVFHTRRVDNRSLEFGIFALIGIIGLGVNQVTIWFLVDIVGLYYLISRAISAAIGYTWKYVARKLILFR